MPPAPVPKPAPRVKNRIKREYDAARQGFLEQEFNRINMTEGGTWVRVDCQCSLPGECPRLERIMIQKRRGRDGGFAYTTTGDVDHVEPRSRRPDLRCDPRNMRLLARHCHRIVKHGGGT